ncbi:MAG: [FeFe] hydrogenase H-cluster radical SAM maturase HydG [Proteobacteria bacterium]|nr:[FeFe] hydrogenase H-cluster radical SAM maturase HydG [Pseudomonadota bacterium]
MKKKIIDSNHIEAILQDAAVPTVEAVSLVLDRAKALGGLALEDVGLLIHAGQDAKLRRQIFDAAREVKLKCFGKRIVLFAPLYLTNDCINNCLYCGFRRDNPDAIRHTLSIEEAVNEAAALEKLGFNRILLVAGESPKNSNVDRIKEIVGAIYENTGIRILHVNAAPMPDTDLKKLKKAGVGVFQVFQEAYHEATYREMHPAGPKKDYEKRLAALDGAIPAGFDDVGIGTLLGLYDWRFEVLAIVNHARHLHEKFGAWPHTISAPRLQPATGSPLTAPPYPVSDEDFKLIVAIYRLAVPPAGIVVTTREPAALRDELIDIGVSQVSAGSRTDPGGYSEKGERFDASQFRTSDHRSLEEMIAYITSTGNLPSLCTSCYRTGRTGKEFTQRVSHEEMERYCLPNSLLTLQEYIIDHANGSADACEDLIRKNLADIKDKKLRAATEKKLAQINTGERDLYF